MLSGHLIMFDLALVNAVPHRLPTDNAYAWRMLDSVPFMEHCVEKNISTIDALLLHQCNSISKLLPIDVDIPALSSVLRDAVDAIGELSCHLVDSCVFITCHVWQARIAPLTWY